MQHRRGDKARGPLESPVAYSKGGVTERLLSCLPRWETTVDSLLRTFHENAFVSRVLVISGSCPRSRTTSGREMTPPVSVGFVLHSNGPLVDVDGYFLHDVSAVVSLESIMTTYRVFSVPLVGLGRRPSWSVRSKGGRSDRDTSLMTSLQPHSTIFSMPGGLWRGSGAPSKTPANLLSCTNVMCENEFDRLKTTLFVMQIEKPSRHQGCQLRYPLS